MVGVVVEALVAEIIDSVGKVVVAEVVMDEVVMGEVVVGEAVAGKLLTEPEIQ